MRERFRQTRDKSRAGGGALVVSCIFMSKKKEERCIIKVLSANQKTLLPACPPQKTAKGQPGCCYGKDINSGLHALGQRVIGGGK